MPMDRGFDIQVVLDKDFDVVSLVNVNQRPWLLAVDNIYFALNSICAIVSVAAPVAPLALVRWLSDSGHTPGALEAL